MNVAPWPWPQDGRVKSIVPTLSTPAALDEGPDRVSGSGRLNGMANISRAARETGGAGDRPDVTDSGILSTGRACLDAAGGAGGSPAGRRYDPDIDGVRGDGHVIRQMFAHAKGPVP